MLSLVAVFGALVGLSFSLALLFLPTLVARQRHHPNTVAIFLINLFLGWTFIGWAISLIWACTWPAPPFFHAPVYRSRIDPFHSLAVANSATSILPPQTPYRRAR